MTTLGEKLRAKIDQVAEAERVLTEAKYAQTIVRYNEDRQRVIDYFNRFLNRTRDQIENGEIPKPVKAPRYIADYTKVIDKPDHPYHDVFKMAVVAFGHDGLKIELEY